MAFDYNLVINPTGQIDDHKLREFFEDIKININNSGKVLQVVTASSDTTFTTTSTSYQTTNLTANITPSSTDNKILIFAIGTTSRTVTNAIKTSLFRGSTNIATSFVGRENTNVSQSSKQPTPLLASDLPSSTSSLTYSVKILSEGGQTVGFGVDGGTQFMILVEIGV